MDSSVAAPRGPGEVGGGGWKLSRRRTRVSTQPPGSLHSGWGGEPPGIMKSTIIINKTLIKVSLMSVPLDPESA